MRSNTARPWVKPLMFSEVSIYRSGHYSYLYDILLLTKDLYLKRQLPRKKKINKKKAAAYPAGVCSQEALCAQGGSWAQKNWSLMSLESPMTEHQLRGRTRGAPKHRPTQQASARWLQAAEHSGYLTPGDSPIQPEKVIFFFFSSFPVLLRSKRNYEGGY